MNRKALEALEARAAIHNCEVFHVSGAEARSNRAEAKKYGGKYWRDENQAAIYAGWYFWQCFPGCLPEGAPMGPYSSYSAALAAAEDMGFLGSDA